MPFRVSGEKGTPLREQPKKPKKIGVSIRGGRVRADQCQVRRSQSRPDHSNKQRKISKEGILI